MPRREGETSELLKSWQPPQRPRQDEDGGGYESRPPRRPRPEGEGEEGFRPRAPRGEGIRARRPRPQEEGGEAAPRGPGFRTRRSRFEGDPDLPSGKQRARPETEERGPGRRETEKGLRTWRPRPEGEAARPAARPRSEGGAGPMRRRQPEAAPPGAEPTAEARPPRPVTPEPRYQMLEATNPHVVAAAKTLAEVENVVIDIERLVFGGEGLGRFEGIPIFVPRSAPGEKVYARLTERRTGWGRAEIIEVLEPSPDRREPPCRHFVEGCGGCDLQHLEDAAQLRHKSASVLESLVRQGGVEIPASALEVIAADAWAYRMRTQLHIKDSDRGREIGYFARNSHELVAVEVCPILAPELEGQLPDLPRLLRDEKHERIDLTSGDGGAVTCSPPVPGLPNGSIEKTIGDFRYEIDARVFFQTHRQLVEKLVEVAIGDAEDASGDAYDLYAGVGLFALPLARRYKRVVAVEGDRVAVRFARRNVKANGLSNVSVEALSVDSFVELLPKNAARVLVDPPRVGLSTPVRRALIAARPRHITYVSCHAPTLARDLRELLKDYSLERIALLDMFPQTGHMEVVVQLRLKDVG